MAQSNVKEIIKEAPEFTRLLNLAAEKLGARALACTDDFFASMDNLVKPGRGIFIVDKYTDRGKWMDGWESRRKRTPGHDWCVIQLGAPGRIHGVDIDTNFFLGNHPPHASIEAAYCPDGDWENAEWTEILGKSHLDPGSQNFYAIENAQNWTHLKLHIYPDGGVARLKVYGKVYKDWDAVGKDELIDLAAALNGAWTMHCNDMFFSAMSNLLMPNRGANMGDGWETKRNRDPENFDWVVIKLAHPGTIEKICVDTAHFKGNYPDRCTVEGAWLREDYNPYQDYKWYPMLWGAKLEADQEHFFAEELVPVGPVNYVRLCIFPDGGISRLRLWGKIERE